MQVRSPLAKVGSVTPMRPKMAGSGLALTIAALGAGLMATALPATALPATALLADGEVATNPYTIGAPSGAVGAVAASPSSVGEGALTNFAITFDLPAALSGPSDDAVTVTPSTALASVPTNVDLVGGSCIQAGTAGVGGAGSATTTALIIEMASHCSLSAGQKVEVDFTADAPSATGQYQLGSNHAQAYRRRDERHSGNRVLQRRSGLHGHVHALRRRDQ
jgi:hypothetical protein